MLSHHICLSADSLNSNFVELAVKERIKKDFPTYLNLSNTIKEEQILQAKFTLMSDSQEIKAKSWPYFKFLLDYMSIKEQFLRYV